MTRRLLIVSDVYGWAWDRMANAIAKWAPQSIDVTVLCQSDLDVLVRKMPWVLKEFDAVSQCSWAESQVKLPLKETAKRTVWLASHGFEYPFPVQDPTHYPHLIATGLRNIDRAATILRCFDGVLCVSNRIMQAMENSRLREAKPVRVVPGVDADDFPVSALPNREKLVVGWCGQRDGKTKGFHEVLKLVRRNIGTKVDWQVNTRSAKDPLSQEEMTSWYRGIDVFLSTSCSEGFQMPLLEAAAAGRPLLATDIGAADEVITDGVNGHLIRPYTSRETAERSAAEIIQRLLEYNEDRDKLLAHGANSHKIVLKQFLWADLAPRWLEAML